MLGVAVRPVPPLPTPKVPASVNVPDVVIGLPETVSPVPPVLNPTDVTVPSPAPVAAIVTEPAPFVIEIPDPAVSVERVNPEPLPISI